jgi:hypothetical protein
MSAYTEAKKQYKIEACAEAMLTILKSKTQDGEYLPLTKKSLIPMIAKRVASEWRKDKYSHVIDGKTIGCPDVKFIKSPPNWRNIRNVSNDALKVNGITWSRAGIKIGSEVDIAKNLSQLESITKGTTRQYNYQAERSNKRGATHPFLQVKQLALPSPDL